MDDRYLDAAADLMGLEIEPDWRPGVRRFLEVAAAMAAVLDRVDLDDAEFALAPVYEPPEAPE